MSKVAKGRLIELDYARSELGRAFVNVYYPVTILESQVRMCLLKIVLPNSLQIGSFAPD